MWNVPLCVRCTRDRTSQVLLWSDSMWCTLPCSSGSSLSNSIFVRQILFTSLSDSVHRYLILYNGCYCPILHEVWHYLILYNVCLYICHYLIPYSVCHLSDSVCHYLILYMSLSNFIGIIWFFMLDIIVLCLNLCLSKFYWLYKQNMFCKQMCFFLTLMINMFLCLTVLASVCMLDWIWYCFSGTFW